MKPISGREIVALLLLLPCVGFCVLAAVGVWRSSSGDNAQHSADSVATAGTAPKAAAATYADSEPNRSVQLFEFDPNTVTYEQLRRLGFAKSTAASIVKYRQRGKRFEIAEDFATCYGVTDSIYAVLKPYIVIGDQFRLRASTSGQQRGSATDENRQSDHSRFVRSDSLFVFDPNKLDVEGYRLLGFTARQAEAMLDYVDRIGGFRSVAEFEECYLVTTANFERLKPYISIEPRPKEQTKVELNTADSATLVGVTGIGARSAEDILLYRNRLGGFCSAEQLTELAVITERNYEMICKQIWVDSCKIRKIDVNFAVPKSMSSHPYMGGRILGRILKQRQLKGGWSRIEEMVEDNTLTEDQAARLRPYLQFNPIDRIDNQ